VADVTVFFHHAIDVSAGMDHAVVLQVGATPKFDAAEIASHHRSRADIATCADNDVADQDSRGMNVCRRVDDRSQPFEGVHMGKGRKVTGHEGTGSVGTGRLLSGCCCRRDA